MYQCVDDPVLSGYVRDRIIASPGYRFVQEVERRFQGVDLFFWGGAVRDPILEGLDGQHRPIYDIDVLVDDSAGDVALAERLEGVEGKVDYNRFGNPKWRPLPDENFDIDIVPLSRTNLTHLDPSRYPTSIRNAIAGCDLTTSAIAYDLQTGVIHDHGALAALKREEVGINYEHADRPHVLMTRLVLHADRFGFGLDQSAREFIADHYDPRRTPGEVDVYLRKKTGLFRHLPMVLRILKGCSYAVAAK